MLDRPNLTGATSLSGQPFVIAKQNDTTAAIPLCLLADTAANVARVFRERDIYLIGNMLPDAIKRATHISSFKDYPIADQVGWNGNYFVLPDGDVISSVDSKVPLVAIKAMPGKCAQGGTLKGWQRKVAAQLIGQTIALFALMMAFMPALLRLSSRRDNFGFEIVGGKGKGKTTIQQLAASVMGPPFAHNGSSYAMTFDMTLNSLEDTMIVHNDMPLIIDEAGLYFAGESKQKRGTLFKAFAFKAAAGTHKGRHGQSQTGDTYRFSYLSSSNDRLTALLDDDEEATKAAADRLLTLPIGEDRDYGVFDFLPEEYNSSSAFAASLSKAVSKHHGTAGRAYLQALVNDRAKHPKRLARQIEHLMARFRELAGVDQNSGSAIRVADAFGLVYAAGKLAVGYDVLPSEVNCEETALACYRQHIQGAQPTQPFVERLKAVLEEPTTTKLADKGDKLKKQQLLAASAITLPGPQGMELLIPDDKIEAVFPDWLSIRRQAAVTSLLMRDGRHLTKKRSLTKNGERKRFYCFRVPDDETAEPEEEFGEE
ncbi:DUF927 domain-containing protein [Sphingomonas sp.]|uniref:DUF927 domain-containing protein n=1 Tax=Sphingomonas sp. TaxID=28214 RepID=UPI0035C82A77